MKLSQDTRILSLLVCGIIVSGGAAQANVMQLTDPSQLAGSDFAAIYPQNPLTSPILVNSPYTVSVPGNQLTFADNGGFQVDSSAMNVGFDNTFGEFSTNPNLLDNATPISGSSAFSYNGPITINFANPVGEFGVMAFSEDDAQNFSYSVMDGSAAPTVFSVLNDPTIATDTNPLADPNFTPDFSPAFLGAKSTGNTITSVTITNVNADPQNGFVLGPALSTAVPEPGPLSLLCIGIAAAPFAMFRRKKS